MLKTVRICGTAQNARELPPHSETGVEVWVANNPTVILLRCPQAMKIWTRWFNLHSKSHIISTYPSGWHYYRTSGRPIYLQKIDTDTPTSIAFPREAIQNTFATKRGPNRYFTCSVCWMLALAIYEGFERIELWGFELRDTKPNSAFAWERPCFAYWVKQAQDHNIKVIWQPAIEKLYQDGKLIPGDPDTYDGPLYGYSTKPEPDWDSVLERFKA